MAVVTVKKPTQVQVEVSANTVQNVFTETDPSLRVTPHLFRSVAQQTGADTDFTQRSPCTRGCPNLCDAVPFESIESRPSGASG